jgi:hypothetical protein
MKMYCRINLRTIERNKKKEKEGRKRRKLGVLSLHSPEGETRQIKKINSLSLLVIICPSYVNSM